MAAIAALLCALVASLAVTVAPAAAEEPAEYMTAGQFPEVTSSASPEEYETRIPLAETDTARQVSEEEIAVSNEEGEEVRWIYLSVAHAADGANVPTTMRLVEGDEVITTVHHREGNPLAGGAPFAYPITEGNGWAGAFHTGTVELNEPKPVAPPTPPPAPPAPTCTVPALHGLTLRAAKTKLRAADCAIGHVGLTRGATLGKGSVVKQFRPAGAQLAAGTAVAVKLAPR